MNRLMKYKKGVGSLLKAVVLVCGTFFLADLEQANRARDEVTKVEADASTKNHNKSASFRMDWFMTMVHRKMFNDAIDHIRDDYDPQDPSSDAARVRALLLEAHQASEDVMSNQLTHALEELDKHIDYIEIDDAVKLRYAAVALRSLRQEYLMALDHANSLVDILPDSANALETRAECWELVDKDCRNLRGHFERVGIDMGDWRIADGKERAIIDLTSAIELDDTVGRRIKRARVEAELFNFKASWEDMKVAEMIATTDKDKESLRLFTWALQVREKEARRIAAL